MSRAMLGRGPCPERESVMGESVMGFGAANTGPLVHGADNLTSLTSRLLTCDVVVIAT